MSLARARTEGLPFDVAWGRAVDNLAGVDAEPLLATREHWRSSYEGRPPTCGAAAFSMLASTRA